MLNPGGGHVEQAHAALLPCAAAGPPGGLSDPQAAVVPGLDRIEDHDGELPALEAVRGADFSQRASAGLHIT